MKGTGQKEKKKNPKKEARKNTEWAVKLFQAWARHWNSQIFTLGEDYPSVPVDLKSISVREVNCWLTGFIVEGVKTDVIHHILRIVNTRLVDEHKNAR